MQAHVLRVNSIGNFCDVVCVSVYTHTYNVSLVHVLMS